MSDDLISKSALLKKTRRMYSPDEIDSIAPIATNCVTVDDIYRAAVVDAVPVVHAKWEIIHGMINPKYQGRKRCSRCGDISPSDMCCREMLTDYCPNCGAKMDGGADDD